MGAEPTTTATTTGKGKDEKRMAIRKETRMPPFAPFAQPGQHFNWDPGGRSIRIYRKMCRSTKRTYEIFHFSDLFTWTIKLPLLWEDPVASHSGHAWQRIHLE